MGSHLLNKNLAHRLTEALPFSWEPRVRIPLGSLAIAQEPGESRFNMAFELRPRCNVWHPWQKLLDAEVSQTAPETEP